MSGFCGVFSPDEPHLASREVLQRMLQPLLRPGRMEPREFVDETAGVALALCHHPGFAPAEAAWAVSEQGACLMAGSLAASMDGPAYPPSDAELLLESCSRTGGFSAGTRGYFAAAVWDARARRVLLANDTLGSVIFYYYAPPSGRLLVFASELKSLLRHPSVPRDLDVNGLAFFLTRGYSPAPLTVLRGVRKSLAAQTVSLTAGGGVQEARHWLPSEANEVAGSLDEWTQRTREALRLTVERLTRRTAKVGLLLSGGVDSSALLVALHDAGIPVEAFTLVDPEDPGDGHWASVAAKALGLRHHVVSAAPASVPADGAARVLREVDEPHDNLSRIVTQYLVSRACAEAGFDACLDGHDSEFLFSLTASPGDEAGGSPLSEAAALIDLYDNGRFLTRKETEETLALPAPTNESLAAALAPDLQRASSPDASAALLRDVLYLRAPSSRYGLFPDMGSSLGGVELRRGFRDHDLFEMARTVPPGLKGADNEDDSRAVLKHLLRCSIPELLQREPKGVFPSLSRGDFFRRHAGFVGSLIERAKTNGVFRREGIEHLQRKHARRGVARTLARLWVIFVFQLWFEQHVLGKDPCAALTGA